MSAEWIGVLIACFPFVTCGLAALGFLGVQSWQTFMRRQDEDRRWKALWTPPPPERTTLGDSWLNHQRSRFKSL